jgi:DNA-binding transcriptional regulator YdaS (Cro superfamily)
MSEAIATKALKEAIRAAGGFHALARHLGISHNAVLDWRRTPPARVIAIEKLTGVSRHRLRPDIYPADFVETTASGERRVYEVKMTKKKAP